MRTSRRCESITDARRDLDRVCARLSVELLAPSTKRGMRRHAVGLAGSAESSSVGNTLGTLKYTSQNRATRVFGLIWTVDLTVFPAFPSAQPCLYPRAS